MFSRTTEKVEISNVTDVESSVVNFFIKLKDGTKVQSSSSVSLDEVLTFEFTERKQRTGRKEMFYLTTHSTTFYLRLNGVTHMVKDHSDSETENPLPPHGLLFPISSKGSFTCIMPQAG